MTENQVKIDPALLVELEQLKEKGRLAEKITVIIRLETGVDKGQKAVLERAGVRISSVINDILTGTIAAKDVSELADLEFVVFIEKSKKQQLR